MDITREPVRRVSLPAADAWAQPNAQSEIPESVIRLRATGGHVFYRLIGYTGTEPGSQPVDGDASVFNCCCVKIKKDAGGNTTLARTVTTLENDGQVGVVGEGQDDSGVRIGEIFVIGIVSATADMATALWVFVDGGAVIA